MKNTTEVFQDIPKLPEWMVLERELRGLKLKDRHIEGVYNLIAGTEQYRKLRNFIREKVEQGEKLNYRIIQMKAWAISAEAREKQKKTSSTQTEHYTHPDLGMGSLTVEQRRKFFIY